MTFQAYSLNFILVDIERLGLYISNVFIIYVQSVLSKKNYNNNQYNILTAFILQQFYTIFNKLSRRNITTWLNSRFIFFHIENSWLNLKWKTFWYLDFSYNQAARNPLINQAFFTAFNIKILVILLSSAKYAKFWFSCY